VRAGPLPAWELDKLADMDYFYIPSSRLTGENGKVELSSYQAWGMVPLQVSDRVTLLPGVGYRGLYLDYSGMNFSYPTPDGRLFTQNDLPHNLHAMTVILSGVIDLGKSWSAFADLRPCLKSDLKEVNSKDISYEGAVVASHVFSESLTALLGLYYDDSFSQPQLLPLGGVQWRVGGGFTLDTILPQYLLFSYQPDPRWKFGLRGRVQGNEFRLSGKTPWDNTVLQYSQIMIGPYADYHLTDHLILRVEGGLVTSRTFKFRDDHSSAKLYNGDLHDSGFFGASLFFEY